MKEQHKLQPEPAEVQENRADFTIRLHQSLRAAGYGISATRLCRTFNDLFPTAPISHHAFRKWIAGGAVPGHDRILMLAHWLRVDPGWLRYGAAVDGRHTTLDDRQLTQFDLNLIEDLLELSEGNRVMVRGLIEVLQRVEQGHRRRKRDGSPAMTGARG